jgi:hypothetical protein
MEIKSKLIVGIGVVALAGPAAALASHGHGGGNGHGGGQTKPAQYNVKGTYAGDGVVSVEKVNGHAKKAGWKGTDVAFDFSSAEVRTDDTNLDGTADLGDVAVGTPVKVKARLPKGDPGVGPYEAQRLVDRSDDVAGDDDAASDEDVADDDSSSDDDDSTDVEETETETDGE